MFKVTPARVRIIGHGLQPVVRAVTHPPGSHKSAIRPELTALELVTPKGSRWYGVRSARISSRLEMEVELLDPRFEEMAAWRNAPKER
jgi:hypothetical protein